MKVILLVTESSLILFNSMDCSPPGPSVHGILQARILSGLPFLFQKHVVVRHKTNALER